MRILIHRDEGIGNLLLSIPAINSIRKNLPNAEINVLIESRAYDLAVGHPSIDHLYKWPEIPKGKFDFGLNFVFSSGTFLSEMRKICKNIISHPKVSFTTKSEALHNLEIAGQIGGWDGKYYPSSIYLSEKEENYGLKITKELQRPIIAIHIGCQTSIPVHRKRFWRMNGWVELLGLFSKKYDPTFILLGGEGEISESKLLFSLVKDRIRVVDMVGKYRIKEGASILKNSDLLISIDSGIMHLASVVGTRFVSLWGPTSEIKSQPWCDQRNYAVVRDETLSCRQCYTRNPRLFQQCTNQICMKNITSEMILDSIEKHGFLTGKN